MSIHLEQSGDERAIIAQHVPDAGFLTTSIGFMLAKCLQQVHAVARPLLEKTGLTPQQLAVMLALMDEDGMTQSHLSEYIGIDRTTTMRIIDRLEAAGRVARTPDPSDRRVHRIRLTPAGLTLLATIAPSLPTMRERFLAPLSEEEREELMRLLGKLRVADTTTTTHDASDAD